MLIEKLHNLRRLPHNVNTVDTCVDAAVCAMPTRSCYERRCDGCKDNLKFGDVKNLQDTVTWEQWETVKEERVIKGKNVMIQRCEANKGWDTFGITKQVRSHLVKALLAHNGDETPIPAVPNHQGEGHVHNDCRLRRITRVVTIGPSKHPTSGHLTSN